MATKKRIRNRSKPTTDAAKPAMPANARPVGTLAAERATQAAHAAHDAAQAIVNDVGNITPPVGAVAVTGKVKLTEAMQNILSKLPANLLRHIEGDTFIGTVSSLLAAHQLFEAAAPSYGFGVRQAAHGAATRCKAAAEHATNKELRRKERKPGTPTPAGTPRPRAAAPALPLPHKADSISSLAIDVDQAREAYETARDRLRKALA